MSSTTQDDDRPTRTVGDPPIRAAFLIEQMLGHITHGINLERLMEATPELNSTFRPIAPSDGGVLTGLPGFRNWTVQAGLQARRHLSRMKREADGLPDVVFVHTQVPAVLLGRWMRRLPTVVSLDATPKQYDELGAMYDHGASHPMVESLKHSLHSRTFDRSAHLVAWSEWAKRGLIEDYGVSAARITVIAPGVDLNIWTGPRHRAEIDRPVRVLFVGGDLVRKGGDVLLAAAELLRAEGEVPEFEVHLVTDPRHVEPSTQAIVHSGLSANSSELIDLYASSDIFCLPTRADTFGIVLAEAAAMGLPLISTDVGAVGELVRNGETGMLVEPDDVRALADALRTLIERPERRRSLGLGARSLAVARHDARANARDIVGLLKRTRRALPG